MDADNLLIPSAAKNVLRAPNHFLCHSCDLDPTDHCQLVVALKVKAFDIKVATHVSTLRVTVYSFHTLFIEFMAKFYKEKTHFVIHYDHNVKNSKN